MPHAKRVGRTVSVSRNVIHVFRMLRCYSPRLFQIRWRSANIHRQRDRQSFRRARSAAVIDGHRKLQIVCPPIRPEGEGWLREKKLLTRLFPVLGRGANIQHGISKGEEQTKGQTCLSPGTISSSDRRSQEVADCLSPYSPKRERGDRK
jgi:hypothetical protein